MFDENRWQEFTCEVENLILDESIEKEKIMRNDFDSFFSFLKYESEKERMINYLNNLDLALLYRDVKGLLVLKKLFEIYQTHVDEILLGWKLMDISMHDIINNPFFFNNESLKNYSSNYFFLYKQQSK